ncbi:bleomycin resistance protein [Streptomyces fodineus]|uniref:Bleomycin resistance protein n=1 Tax=Streptomyces fodineus TaxID=1904616 RepID=A0A1D7Y834_9ACTN|nr:VOC family protein [Streptomyces fodineus]AOR31664.1 bleomycin resistance protein [Streptomyces fodineus]
MTEAREPAGPHARRAPGAPCWVSLMAHGLAATEEFYGELFGWEFRPGPRQLGPYVRALLDGHEVAGMGQLPPDRRLPIAWTPYLASDDVDQTADTVRECGGTVAVGPLDAAEAGRMAIASDPSGAVFGIWQGAAHLGTTITGVPGTPAWNELVTFETESVSKFYATVFGYEREPVVSADFDYVTLHLAGRPVAGLHGMGHGLPRDRGPHWQTYFEVADVEATVRQVADLGGNVIRQPYDSPHGRVATVADPEGAEFAVTENPR